MTTVGSLAATDLGPGQEISNSGAMELPPSPANSIPFIITTSAEEDKSEKRVPVNGASPIRSLQACSKLDMEPNPFEQSFSKTGTIGTSESSSSNGEQSTVETPKTVLPPIASMSGRLAPGTDQFNWDTQSLRMGPLSPSMLEGPQNPIVFDDDIVANPAPISSFPSSSAPSISAPSISSIFNPAAPIQDNSMTMVGISGTQQPIPSLPPPPLHAGPAPTDPFQPSVFNQSSSMVQSQQQQPSQGQQQQSSYPQGGSGPRPNQPLSNPNAQPYVNDRYGPPPPPPPPQSGAHGDNYGNLHLLSQATREAWIKRESVDTNGLLSHSQVQSQHPHHSQQQQQSMPHHPHGSSGPIKAGQSLPGMPGMVAAPQLPKNGVEPAFVRGVRRTKITSDDNSDDSDKHSSNSDNMTDKGDGYSSMNGAGANGTNSKKRGAEDRPMDEDEKRKNFLERNRQAALKCRQRKKQWLANLQTKVEYLSNDNEQLQAQTAALRDEIIRLKALLLAHKDCPVAQANGVYAETIGGVMGHGRASGAPMHQGPPGRGGPPGPPRGSLPPPPHGHLPQGGLPHPHGRMMAGSMHPGAGPVGPNGIPGSGVGNRPMSMMQDITPNASPSQTQATLRY